MAKDLLLNVLLDILGSYVVGLTKENLKIGVWAGKIELFNLKLKSTALDQFNLPIQVNKGSLQKLKLKIPWASLDKKPVKIIIDGIYLEASPIDLIKLSSNEIKSMILSTKMKVIEQVELAIINVIQNKESLHMKLKKTSYLQQLTSKILDNIEFQVTNIHFRYIDDQSIPNTAFATGLMIESLLLNTTDESWCNSFINRTSSVDNEQGHQAIHKLGTIKNMSIYWNTILLDTTRSNNAAADEHWEKKMYAMIYSHKQYVEESQYLDTKNESMVYILHPFNECIIKIIHTQKCNEYTPNADVIVESGTLDFNLNEQQYQQLLAVNKYFNDLDRKKFLMSYRPLKRPTEDPRGWWQYAFKLIVKKEVFTRNKMHLMVDCIRAKSIYVPYYKKIIVHQEILRYLDYSDEDIIKYRSNTLGRLSQSEEIKRIIDELPLDVVIGLHQQSTREAVIEIQKLQSDPQLLQKLLDVYEIRLDKPIITSSNSNNMKSNSKMNVNKPKSSFFSFFRSSKTPSNTTNFQNSDSDTNNNNNNANNNNRWDQDNKPIPVDAEDEIAMLKLEAAMQQVDIATNDKQTFSLRLQLISNTTLQIGFLSKPIAKLHMACKGQLELRHNDLLVSYEVNGLGVDDLISIDPISNRIVSELFVNTVETELVDQSYFQIILNLKPNKSSLQLKSKPILLLLNEPFVNKSMEFFLSPYHVITSQDRFIYKRTMRNSNSIQASPFSAYSDSELDVQMQIFAPIILIPEDYGSSQCGVLRLDTGPIRVKGNIDKTGIKFHINAQDLNITMPKSFEREYYKLLNNSNATKDSKQRFSINKINSIAIDCIENHRNSNAYLIKPFSIICDVEKIFGSNTGVDLKVAIVSSIDMQLDPMKLVRLESLYNLVNRSFLNHLLQLTNKNTTTRPISATNHTISTTIEDMDKSVLNFHLVLAKLSCSFYEFNPKKDHSKIFEFNLNEIQTTIIDRIADLNIEFTLESILLVDDSMRNILVTPEKSSMKLIFRLYKSLHSSLYNGYAQELSIFGREFLVNLEANTILLISQNIANFNELHQANLMSNIAQSPSSLNVIDNSNMYNIPNNMKVTILLNSIGVKLLDDTVVIGHKTISTQSDFVFLICAKNISLTLEDNEILFRMLKKSMKDQQPQQQDLLRIEATMTDLIIEDIRSNSTSNLFNTVITSNRVLVIDNNDNDGITGNNEYSLNLNPSSNGVYADKSTKFPPPSNTMKSEHLLSIIIYKKSQSLLNIEISCQDVHAFVTPEPLILLLKLSLSMLNAFLELHLVLLNNHWYNGEINIKSDPSNANQSASQFQSSTESNDDTVCLNVVCNMINPRLFLLECPTKKNTKAFVLDGNIKVVYIHNISTSYCSNESKMMRSDDIIGLESKTMVPSSSKVVNELVYLSLTNAQVLVLNDIQGDDSISHKIIEPMWIDIQIKRNSEKNIVLINDLKLTSDGMLSRVSLNDLALSMSILKQAKGHMMNIFGSNEIKTKDIINSGSNSSGKSEFKSVAVFKIFLSIKKIQLVLINDFNNQNDLPMFRIAVNNIDSTLNGTWINLEGELIFVLSMDYFNPFITFHTSYWEPVIEPWQPTIVLVHDFNGIRVVMDSLDRVLQLNLSGSMLRCIHQIILFISKIDKEGISFELKGKKYPVTIHNELGFPILLYNSKTKKQIKLLDETSTEYRSSMIEELDSGVDIHLTGELAHQRQPILQASVYSAKPKRFKFELANGLLADQAASIATKPIHTSMNTLDPIEEEIFENQRYYPLQGTWSEPWTNMGDPSLFTDVKGQMCNSPKSFICPKDWYWVESDWKIDIGKIGFETDRDGWQYETIFGAFSTSRFKRRAKLALDSVRRRRWFRSRLPVQKKITPTTASGANDKIVTMKESISTEPWVLYWDVYMKSDEVREVFISSGVHIRNELPYDLEIEMIEPLAKEVSHSNTTQSRFVVGGKKVFGVPLNLVKFSHMKLRPHNMQFDWSQTISYKQPITDLTSDKNFAPKMQRIVCMNVKNSQPFYLTIHIFRANDSKKLLISCSSSLIISNRLPCPISILCMNPSTNDFSGTVRCSTAIIEPGGLIDESHIDVHQIISLNLSVGTYSSLEPVEILYNEENCRSDFNHIVYNKQVLLCDHSSNNTKEGATKDQNQLMLVTIKSILSNLGVLEIYIYSQYLLVDLSSSNIVISTDWSKDPIENNSNLIDFFSSKSSAKENSSVLIKRFSYFSTHRNDSSEAFKILFDQTEQINFNEQDLASYWAPGNSGVTLFQANKDNKISLGINAGGGWVSNLSMNSLTRNKTPIEIIDNTTKNACNIALILQPLTDLHSVCPTRILKIIPCYTIINYMDERIELLHPEDETLDNQQSFVIESKCCKAWHRPGNFSSTNVRLRCASSTGSIGFIDLNEIGTTLLILPKKAKKSVKASDHHRNNNNNSTVVPSTEYEDDWIVANIEVKFAEVKDRSYINVIIWRSSMKHRKDGSIDASIVSLSVKNDTDVCFTIEQDGMDEILSKKIGESVIGSLSDVKSRFELCVKPKRWLPFGWVDSNRPKVIAVSAGQSPSKTGTLCTVDTMLYNVEKLIDLSYCGSANIKVSLMTYGYGKVLHIYKDEAVQVPIGIRGGEKTTNVNNTNKEIDTESMVDKINWISHDDNAIGTAAMLKILFSSISLSLLAEGPSRRELFALHFQNFESKIQRLPVNTDNKLKSMNIIFELKLRDLQIDNYSSTSALHPVLLTSAYSEDRRKENKQKMRSQYLQSTRTLPSTNVQIAPTAPSTMAGHKEHQQSIQGMAAEEEYQSFIECSLVREIHIHNKNCSPIIKYLALRILEMNVAIDSSSILEYFIDLHQDIIYNPNLIDAKSLKTVMQNNEAIDRCQELDQLQVTQYFNNFNQSVVRYLIRQNSSGAVNVKKAYNHALASKVCFESLIIHPIKVSLTFTPTSCTRFDSDSIVQSTHKLKMLQGMHGIPAVEQFEVKIGSFIVNHAMESITSMYRRILLKTRNELKSSLMSMGGNLLGSMSILGKPAGLLKNIGEGAEDFFYEPYLGSMISPSAFVLGIGKGTGAFIGGFAAGVFGTTANVVVSATGGLSSAMSSGVETLTGDDYYTRNREAKRRSIGTSQGGVLGGMKTGGENIFTGVAAGITGLVTKPIEEGKKTGALGFMKGVGMGLVGVAVKPVLGITDGISSVASGFTQQITDSSTIANHYRPQRALERIDPSNHIHQLLLVPFDIFSADCQYFIHNKAALNHYTDEYLASFKLGYKRTDYLDINTMYGIAISSQYIYCMTANNQLLWEIAFTNLSHVLYKEQVVSNQTNKKYIIECILYNTENLSEKSKSITCVNKNYAINLYTLFLNFSNKMGNPSKLLSIEAIITKDDSSSKKDIKDNDRNVSKEVITSSYEFTNRNPCFYPKQILSDEQIINFARKSFGLIHIPKPNNDNNISLISNNNHTLTMMNSYYQLLDQNIWQLLSNWKNNHHIRYASRHTVCLIINNSTHCIKLNEIVLKEGKNYEIFSTDGLNGNRIPSYDPDSRILIGNGGSLVIFAYGHTPSLTDLAHVKVKLYSSAFEMMIATRKARSYCREINDFHAGFINKTETSDFWSKFVVMIT